MPEVADLLARRSPDTLLVAAGGIADGRGLAASLMLGADGAMIGSRLWVSPECPIHPDHQRTALASDGDGTIRQIAADIARGYDWPEEFPRWISMTGLTCQTGRHLDGRFRRISPAAAVAANDRSPHPKRTFVVAVAVFR